MQKAKIFLKLPVWFELLSQLKIKGKGKNESGAFLLAQSNSNIVTDFICYDDLDSNAYDTGIIRFKSEGYSALWDYCIKNNVYVIADIHTHPSFWTGQSFADKSNPMISQYGHIALIVPNYAQKKHKNLRGVGVYEYLGNYKWKSYFKKSTAVRFIN